MNVIRRNNKKLHNMIYNKNVVICGPAPYLNELNNGEIINRSDTVIRVNKGHNLTKDPKHFGSRTDILYHCVCENDENGGKITKQMLKEIKIIVAAFPNLKPSDKTSFPNGNKNKFIKLKKKIKPKMSVIGKKFYINLEKIIGCRPNTGIIAISHILRHNPKSLYITGFTFFKDGYSKLYRNKIDGTKVTEKNSNEAVIKRMTKHNYKGRHNQLFMFKFTKNLINNYRNKLILDDKLIDILNFDINKYKKKHNLYNKSPEQIFNHFLIN